jgi:UDP-N-acetylglucosamine/UDP-N-acetylgalactosamine diphosphorylase
LKEVPSWDPETMALQKPTGPNAVKLERFIFDVLGRAERSAILATERAEEFAPIKNAQGPDSPLTSRQLQSDLFARWLEERGVVLPWTSDGHVDAAIEIAPSTAMSSSEIPSEVLPGSIEPGSSILL